jgi:hypothetical protein
MIDERPPSPFFGQLVMDMARIIGHLCEDVGRSTVIGTGRHSVRQRPSAPPHATEVHRHLFVCGEPGARRRVLTCPSQVLPEMSAIIHQRDALEVENDRLRATVESR